MSLISIHSPQDIQIMSNLGKICADLFFQIQPFIVPGVSTKELDQHLANLLKLNTNDPNLASACLGYRGFPAFACISVNEEIVHCIPSDRKLKNGDIVTIDFGVKTTDGKRDWNSDTAKTFFVGDVDPEVKKFVEVGYQALLAGIKAAKAGNCVNDISIAVDNVITSNNYGIVKQFVGHGIGKSIHEDPMIPNCKMDKPGATLSEGMIICIEPILTIKPNVPVERIGDWNIVSKDGTWACHWEHMCLITKDGAKVLSKRIEETF